MIVAKRVYGGVSVRDTLSEEEKVISEEEYNRLCEEIDVKHNMSVVNIGGYKYSVTDDITGGRVEVGFRELDEAYTKFPEQFNIDYSNLDKYISKLLMGGATYEEKAGRVRLVELPCKGDNEIKLRVRSFSNAVTYILRANDKNCLIEENDCYKIIIPKYISKVHITVQAKLDKKLKIDLPMGVKKFHIWSLHSLSLELSTVPTLSELSLYYTNIDRMYVPNKCVAMDVNGVFSINTDFVDCVIDRLEVGSNLRLKSVLYGCMENTLIYDVIQDVGVTRIRRNLNNKNSTIVREGCLEYKH